MRLIVVSNLIPFHIGACGAQSSEWFVSVKTVHRPTCYALKPHQIKCKNTYKIIRTAWLVGRAIARSFVRSVCAQPFNHRLSGGPANEIENTTKNHKRIGVAVCHCGGNINSINYLNHIIRALKFNPMGQVKWSKVSLFPPPAHLCVLPALNNGSDDTMAYVPKTCTYPYAEKKVHKNVWMVRNLYIESRHQLTGISLWTAVATAAAAAVAAVRVKRCTWHIHSLFIDWYWCWHSKKHEI